jgi:hypothetical protein
VINLCVTYLTVIIEIENLIESFIIPSLQCKSFRNGGGGGGGYAVDFEDCDDPNAHIYWTFERYG